jgi:hypothetical protein
MRCSTAATTAFHRFMRWPAALDLVEAGVRSGQTKRAREVAAGLEVVDERTAAPVPPG